MEYFDGAFNVNYWSLTAMITKTGLVW